MTYYEIDALPTAPRRHVIISYYVSDLIQDDWFPVSFEYETPLDLILIILVQICSSNDEGVMAQWVARLTRDRWMPASREFDSSMARRFLEQEIIA